MSALHVTIAGTALASVLWSARPSAAAPQRPVPELESTLPDRFVPEAERAKSGVPRRGGRLDVHIEALPDSLNWLIVNTTAARRVAAEVHETLLDRDTWTTEVRLVLAESMQVDDTLVRRDGRQLYGRVEDAGEHWVVHPCTPAGEGASSPARVPKGDTERIERSTVFTFTLRDGVRWHDGAPLCVEDFLFTWRMTKNPHVRCDEKRFEYDHLVRAEKLDERRLRFWYDEQYFAAPIVFEALIPLPAHLFDLADPRHPEHDPGASAEKQARYLHEHPANRAWVGLGPYRLTQFTNEFIEAQRFDAYFDAARAGHVDQIRWRFLASGSAAYEAVLAGELDFSSRIPTDEYFKAESDPRFAARCYRGHYWTPQMQYVGWNTLRPALADVRARTALAHAFDWDAFAQLYYRGLAQRVTAEWYDGGRDYDRELAPLTFDMPRARQLLAEAGWYDRDGDGWIDRDGRAFELRLLVQAANPTGDALGLRFQENLKALGIRLHLEPLDWGALTNRVLARDFDAVFKAWVMPVESDPEQRWHSSTVGPNTANDTSYSAPEIDRLIERFTRELDPERRGAISRELQRQLYAAQAYMYGVKVPHKFVIDKRLRNVRLGPVDPGYELRDWYFVEP
jgi:peptide/nickel transport system substrate-binding protein